MPKTTPPLPVKVGDRVWVFDENRRVYPKDERGHSTGHSPIWREHWIEHRIVGENRATFFLWSGKDHSFQTDRLSIYRRLSKADLKSGEPLRGMIFDEKDLDRRAWVHENAYKLSDAVRRSLNFEALAQVARLVAPDMAPPDDL